VHNFFAPLKLQEYTLCMKKYILMFSVLGLLIMPLVSRATVDEDLIDVDPDPNTSTCVSLSYNLRYQSRDATTNGEVSSLQDFLQSKGYLNSEPTGYFGLLTVAAVKKFQGANSIQPTGYVGPITRAKIKAVSCDGVTSNAVNFFYTQTAGKFKFSLSSPKLFDTVIVNSNCSNDEIAFSSGLGWPSCGYKSVDLMPTNGIEYTVNLKSKDSNVHYVNVKVDLYYREGYVGTSSLNVEVYPVTNNSTPKVISPNGGETIKLNDEFKVVFKPVLNQKHYVNLYNSSTDGAFSLKVRNSNTDGTVTGKYTDGEKQVVYATIPTNYGIQPGSIYKIEICTLGGCDFSDRTFTVSGNSPSITVTAPIGGEYKRGENIGISWTHNAAYNTEFGINLLKEASNGLGGGDLAANIKLCEGSPENSRAQVYWWGNAGKDINGRTVPDGKYYVLVYDCAGGTMSGESERPFSLVTGSSSSLTVVSPNGGETWTKGATKTIRWSDGRPEIVCDNCGAPAPRYYNITLEPYTTPCTTNICPQYQTRSYKIYSTRNLSYSWSVGRTSDNSSVTSGVYYMQVCEATTGVCDISDDYFKIISDVIELPVNNDPVLGPIAVLADIGVGQSVNFNFSATDANNDDLYWSVDWGDEGSAMACPRYPFTGTGQNWRYSQAHTWLTEGTYTVKVYVNDCKGGSAETSFTVTVGSGYHLFQNPTPLPVVYGAESFIFTQSLKRGSIGNEVIELQKYLNAHGYEAGYVDGYFGLQVQTALVKFQIANNITPDGVVGPTTRVILNK
jgi:peptidoglycan hydrolase-like protein with peptidoglycan-binding domain